MMVDYWTHWQNWKATLRTKIPQIAQSTLLWLTLWELLCQVLWQTWSRLVAQAHTRWPLTNPNTVLMILTTSSWEQWPLPQTPRQSTSRFKSDNTPLIWLAGQKSDMQSQDNGMLPPTISWEQMSTETQAAMLLNGQPGMTMCTILRFCSPMLIYHNGW